VISIILGGGASTHLDPLTFHRATPAVPIGGAYRLIDVPMSNCINSGINKIYILTQYNSTSLNRHLAHTYNFGNHGVNFGNGYVEVLAATQRPGVGGENWFQGPADAVRQYMWLFEVRLFQFSLTIPSILLCPFCFNFGLMMHTKFLFLSGFVASQRENNDQNIV
jgi:glucose-1-phosphate adenylyltransferase